MISMIVAVSKNNQIGCNNKLLWHLPEDMKYFKQKTLHHPVIMGRKTYESIGKALPNRENIVLTHDTTFSAPNIKTASSVEAALKLCDNASETFIIGGGQIYQLFLPYANRLYITTVDDIVEGDTTFPDYTSSFRCISSIEGKEINANGPSYAFTIWDRL